LMKSLPEAKWLLADRGYDADWFRETLREKGTTPAFLGASRARKPSSMTNAATSDEIVSRECSAGSRIAAHRNPIRPIPNRIALRNCSRGNRHILVGSTDAKHDQTLYKKTIDTYFRDFATRVRGLIPHRPCTLACKHSEIRFETWVITSMTCGFACECSRSSKTNRSIRSTATARRAKAIAIEDGRDNFWDTAT
jgi:hypothetical protein